MKNVIPAFFYPLFSAAVGSLIQFGVYSLQGTNGDKVSCAAFLVFQAMLTISIATPLAWLGGRLGIPSPIASFLIGMFALWPQRTLGDNVYCLAK